MVVRVILGYDWFVWIPSISLILSYLLPMYFYIYRPSEPLVPGYNNIVRHCVCPSSPTSSRCGHHSALFFISFSLFFLLVVVFVGFSPAPTHSRAWHHNRTLLSDLCCIDISDDWLLRLRQLHLDYGTKGYHPYWALLPISSLVQVSALLTFGLQRDVRVYGS